ncbi:MAG: UTP--glucose-1-phosphate uridylyltransferase, partial [Bauldia sp.]|nr:UTP--glucose-1-phosphate uridylyltransferase [Bauldia sp.]
PGDCSFTRQQEPLGLGHAIWCARHIVGDEPFAVLLPDMLMRGERKGCLAQLMDVYSETGGNVIAVEECDPSQTGSYGIVGKGEAIGDAFRITTMVEKPAPKDAPSNLFISGRYIFQPELFDHIARFESGAGGEIQVTDAMRRLSAEQPFFGHRFRGRSYDCGMKPGFLAANIALALENPEMAAAVRAELKALMAPA